MKTIGLIGGMSWESSALYYKIINQRVQHILGGVHSADCLLYSVDFAEIAGLQHDNNWDELADVMVAAAQRLENGGADFIVLCTNTMHKLAAQIEEKVSIPLLHIADATAAEIQRQGFKKVGLVATKFSMEEDFLKSRYREKFGIEILIPEQEERNEIHSIIYNELVKGIIKEDSRQKFLSVIEQLVSNGAGGIILGCTEIELLINQKDTSTTLFETTKIHAEAAVQFSLR